jgi:hypothetical protein
MIFLSSFNPPISALIKYIPAGLPCALQTIVFPLPTEAYDAIRFPATSKIETFPGLGSETMAFE